MPPVEQGPDSGSTATDFNAVRLDRQGNPAYRLLRAINDRLVGRFQWAVEHPREAQEQVMKRILRGARGTLFAQRHRLESITTLSEYRSRLPISDYQDHLPYIQRIAAGQKRVLTRAKVMQFLQTSGTTGGAKLIPVTAAYARAVEQAQRIWILGLLRQHEELAKGSALTLVSPAVAGHTRGGIPYGSNTGRMHLRQPFWIRHRYPVPYPAYCIGDPETRLYSVLRFAMAADVRSITTANPTTVLLIARRLQEYRADLERDLSEGTLRHGPARQLPTELRRELERRLGTTPPPVAWKPASIWNLSVINCWTGGSAGYFLPMLAPALGEEIPIREVGISASESFMALSLSDDWRGAVAWPLGELLEFVAEDGSLHWLWELEQDVVYRTVISGLHGLYRYDLGDLVRVVGRYGNTPVLKFVRRRGNIISVTGEKLCENHVLEAMKALFGDTGPERRPGGFMVGVRWAQVPHYVVATEGSPLMEAFSDRFDQALMRANVEYSSKRRSGRLGAMEHVRLPPGTFEELRRQAISRGTPEDQYKQPIMALDQQQWARLENAATRAAGGTRVP